MIETFRLPDLGEGLTESELAQWHVNVGDTVELTFTEALALKVVEASAK